MKLTLLDVKGKPFGTVEIPEESLKASLKECLPLPAQAELKDNEPAKDPIAAQKSEAELAALQDKVAHFEDPEFIKARLMELAASWTEDDYRLIGEWRGFATARTLTPDEEAALAEDDLVEDGKVPMEDAAEPNPPTQKTVIVFNKKTYEVVK